MGIGSLSRRSVAVVAVGMLLLGACADGEDAAEEASPSPTATAEPEPEALTVTGVDYAYEGVPGEIEAGTTVTLQNDSEGEVHEILAFRIDDDEDRPVSELLQSPEEMEQAMEMRGVALAPPGGSSAEFPAPPLTLEQPGRYAFLCGIPTGAPPDEVLAAAQEFAESGETEGEPDYPETGPPHFTQGMFAEVTVTAG